MVGRRIVAVGQERFKNENTGRMEVAVQWIGLDNGAVISLTAAESHAEPYVHAVVRQSAKPRGHQCPTVVFPLAGEVGRCVDCGRAWTRAQIDSREAELRRRRP